MASDAVITYDGQTCALTDVRVGDRVTVTTDTQEGTTVATTIKVRQADREAAVLPSIGIMGAPSDNRVSAIE